jgi:hypothetical protein
LQAFTTMSSEEVNKTKEENNAERQNALMVCIKI